ncbi:protein lingerer-like isoform X1 [Macrobrachium nipponense]|uniref:protein lingerer-like isoform X1 n=1 Tax=Macrobrachium nipponense TaxID=159736 RepID=UPI0030C86DF9
MQFTGVEADEAMVALHDCDNDVNAAIDALLEGDDQGKWLESTKKKKKPTTTKPTEAENNKENRRLDSRERSSSRPRGGGPPRFRGRGGGSNRGGRESDGWDGPGRGEGSRRGRMTNGTSVTRGRGGRGRGGSVGPRTFQNRQAPGFPDSIDTWGPVTEDKPNHQNNLKIDNWDDEPPASSDDWDSEWTGSLEETTVFCPSSSSVATNITPVLSESLPDPMAVGSASVGSAVSLAPTPVYVTTPQSYAPSTTATYSSASVSTYSSATSSTASITQPQTMDLVSLLQKAAPQSTLSGLVPPSSLGGTNNNNSVSGGATLVSPAPGLNVGGQHGILAGLNTNVGESLKAGSLVGSVAATVPSPASSAPPPYSSPTAQLQAAIFSNSGLHSGVSSSLASSISNSSNSVINNKSVSLSTVSSSLPSRPKTQRPRIPQASKIPLSAVEMPEDAMAALDVQFSGLEFGAETFDFTAEVKTSSSTSCGVNTTPISSRDPSTPPATKDLTSASLASPLSQTQKLGPEPIPFPSSQTAERKPSGGAFGSGTQRSSASNSAAPQGLSELAKNETGGGTGGLGSLVGTAGPTYQPYTSSKPTSSSSSSFPSPPSAAPYSQPPSQNSYSTTNQQGGSGVSSSNSTVYSNTNSGSTGTNSNNSSSSQGGYGSSFSVQASGAGSSNGQYQNSYANASSHSSLGSITAPKTLTGLSTSPAVKDATQSFGEQTSTGASGLSSTLSTSATVSSNVTSSTGSAVLSATLNSAPTLPVQPSKPSVPGKVISSLGGTVPPGVPHHQPHMHQQQVQQHQAQHQQQQQQQQHQQQMMAQHSQYVSPPAAALQGALPPAFYTGLQQPTMYSLEDFQLLQQRMPHMQAPTSLATGREGNITSAAYSAADAKFRTDQNSSPVPSTMNQQVGQGAQAGGTYITATGNAAMPPFYMYHNMAAVPSSFPQYGAPTAIIQIPPVTNAHTGSTTNQFPAAPKLQYGTGNYYDNITQTQDFKTGYGTASQNQTKGGGATTGSATNSGSDLGGYKNHLKMGRSYDKQGFHTGTPPPFNLAGSGTNPMTANAYTPMFIPTMPAAQHHSPLMHHQLHQDGASSGGQRAATTGGQNKGGSKPSYGGSYWGTN